MAQPVFAHPHSPKESVLQEDCLSSVFALWACFLSPLLIMEAVLRTASEVTSIVFIDESSFCTGLVTVHSVVQRIGQ
jgi:hypothetical protein